MASSFLWLIPVVIFIVIIVLILVLYFSTPSRKNFSFQKRHALITGGSKGIGKQLAKELLSRGCNVSIVARNKTDLEKTCEELQTLADQRSFGQKVRWFSCDLTKGYENIESVIRKAETELGPVEILINNAGHSVQAPFADLPVGDFESQMQVNYLSAVYATRAVVENMKERRSGHISFVSSAAGQCAIFGYSAYSPTKFALRGFADSLHMELLPYKINVAVLYPPNTNTEGFKLELTTMPEETMLISDSAGLFTPEEVAKSHCNDIEAGNYATAIGLDGWMLSVLTAGASPEKSLGRVLVQICLAGLFRGIMLCYLGYFNGIVKKCHIRRKNAQEESPDNMPKEKDVSTRLIRPTIANIDVNRLMLFVARYDQNWELDASIQIYDEGIAQYMLTDAESHYKYLSALILGKASLRCRLTPNEPEDILDESGNTITLENLESLTVEDQKRLDYLQNILGARGFRFVH